MAFGGAARHCGSCACAVHLSIARMIPRTWASGVEQRNYSRESLSRNNVPHCPEPNDSPSEATRCKQQGCGLQKDHTDCRAVHVGACLPCVSIGRVSRFVSEKETATRLETMTCRPVTQPTHPFRLPRDCSVQLLYVSRRSRAMVGSSSQSRVLFQWSCGPLQAFSTTALSDGWSIRN